MHRKDRLFARFVHRCISLCHPERRRSRSRRIFPGPKERPVSPALPLAENAAGLRFSLHSPTAAEIASLLLLPPTAQARNSPGSGRGSVILRRAATKNPPGDDVGAAISRPPPVQTVGAGASTARSSVILSEAGGRVEGSSHVRRKDSSTRPKGLAQNDSVPGVLRRDAPQNDSARGDSSGCALRMTASPRRGGRKRGGI